MAQRPTWFSKMGDWPHDVVKQATDEFNAEVKHDQRVDLICTLEEGDDTFTRYSRSIAFGGR